MNTFLIILACLMLAGSIVGAFAASRWAAPAAFAGLALAGLSDYTVFSTGTYLFWFIATMIVVAIGFMLPLQVVKSRLGTGYLAGAALAGTLTGLCIGHAGVIIGAVAGAFLGALAWSRTPSGRAVGLTSRKGMNYLCAKAFPIVITVCMVGTVIAALTVGVI